MATSKCPKCGKTNFEIVRNRMKFPIKENKNCRDIFFVRCSECGCVVGVIDSILNDIADSLGLDEKYSLY